MFSYADSRNSESDTPRFPSGSYTRIQKAKGSLAEFLALAESLDHIIQRGSKERQNAAQQVQISREERMKAFLPEAL